MHTSSVGELEHMVLTPSSPIDVPIHMLEIYK